MTSFGPFRKSVFLLPFVTTDKRKSPSGLSEMTEKVVQTNRLQEVKKDKRLDVIERMNTITASKTVSHRSFFSSFQHIH